MFSVSFYVKNSTKHVDNLLKFVLDALEMVVYSNDKFVYKVTAYKILVAMMDQRTLIEVRALRPS
jgi:Holliday junction resolvase RusA-like endonuclease